MKTLLPFFLLFFTAAHSLCAQTFKLTDKVFKEGDVYFMDDIHLSSSKWGIRPEGKVILDSVVNLLHNNKYISIEIGSHTDTRGPENYHETYSMKRAKLITDYLVAEGVDSNKVIAKGYGETAPRVIYANTSFFKKGDIITDAYINKLRTEENKEEAHQKNRRIELKILKVEPRYFKLTDTVFNVGDVYIAEGIYFEFDKWNVLEESIEQIDSIVNFMKKNNKLVIEIGGYVNYDSKIAHKRGEALNNILVKRGIRKNRLKVVGYSIDKASIAWSTKPDYPRNVMPRRIELKILKTE